MTAALRDGARVVGIATTVLVVAAWALCLRPVPLGGDATYVLVSGTSMEPSMHTGDLAVVRRRPSYAIGDVITYRVPAAEAGAGNRVIHRIVGGSADAGFVVRGDNRDEDDRWHPTPRDIEGAVWTVVPGVGQAVGAAASPLGLAAIAGALTAWVALGSLPKD